MGLNSPLCGKLSWNQKEWGLKLLQLVMCEETTGRWHNESLIASWRTRSIKKYVSHANTNTFIYGSNQEHRVHLISVLLMYCIWLCAGLMQIWDSFSQMNQTPYWALIPFSTMKPDTRSNLGLNSWRQQNDQKLQDYQIFQMHYSLPIKHEAHLLWCQLQSSEAAFARETMTLKYLGGWSWGEAWGLKEGFQEMKTEVTTNPEERQADDGDRGQRKRRG